MKCFSRNCSNMKKKIIDGIPKFDKKCRLLEYLYPVIVSYIHCKNNENLVCGIGLSA